MIHRVSLDEFDGLFDTVITGAYRLEARQVYTSADEAEDYARWLRGEPSPEMSWQTDPWLANVRATTDRGARWQRVRLVRRPLVDYTRWELGELLANVEAGEDVRILDLNQHPHFERLEHQDFWLLNDDPPLKLLYDDAGRLIALERDTGALDRCRAIKHETIAASTPLTEYLEAIRV
jgi:hypothetical protein